MGKDSSEIRRQIEETRARMGDTVEALSYKADVPARAKDAVNEKIETVKDAVNDKVETVKGTIGDVVSNVKDALGGASDKVGSALGGAKQKAGSTWNDTSGKVGDVGDTLSDKLGNVKGTVTDKLGSVTDKLPSAGDVTGAAKRGVGIVTENPLGLVVGAAAVGFLAGLLAPVTDYERDTIGPIRDDLVEKAQSMGSDVLEHGKAVLQETAQAALSTAQQSAQTHGQQVVKTVQDQTGQSGGTGSSTATSTADMGTTPTTEYGKLLDDDLTPGAPGTASP